MRNYEEGKVVKDLNLKSDLNVNQSQRVIQELMSPYSKGDVGIKSKGKIDFLTRYCDYVHYYVQKF